MATEEMQSFIHYAVVHVIRRFVPFQNNLTVRGSIVIDADNCQVCSIGFDDGISPSSISNARKDGGIDQCSGDAKEDLFFARLFQDSAGSSTKKRMKHEYLKLSCYNTGRNVEDFSVDIDEEISGIIGAAGINRHQISNTGHLRKKYSPSEFHVDHKLRDRAVGIHFSSKNLTSSVHRDVPHSDMHRVLWGNNSKLSTNGNSHPGDCVKIKISPDSLMMKTNSITKCEQNRLDVNSHVSRIATVKSMRGFGMRRVIEDNHDNDEILNDNLDSIDRREEEEEEESLEYKRNRPLLKKRRIGSSHLSQIIQSCESKSSFDSDASLDLEVKLGSVLQENCFATRNIIGGHTDTAFGRRNDRPSRKHIDCFETRTAEILSSNDQRKSEKLLSCPASMEFGSLASVPISLDISLPRLSTASLIARTSAVDSLSLIWKPNSFANNVSASASQPITRTASPHSIFSTVASLQISKTVSPDWDSTAMPVERTNTTLSPIEISTSNVPLVTISLASPACTSSPPSPAVMSRPVSPTVINPVSSASGDVSTAPAIKSSELLPMISITDSLAASASKSIESRSLALDVTTTSTVNSRPANIDHMVSTIVLTEAVINSSVTATATTNMPKLLKFSGRDSSIVTNNDTIMTGHVYSKSEHRLNYKAHRQLNSRNERRRASRTHNSRDALSRYENNSYAENERNHLNGRGIVETPKGPSDKNEVSLTKGRVIRLRSVEVDTALDVVNFEGEDAEDSRVTLSNMLSLRDNDVRNEREGESTDKRNLAISPESSLIAQQERQPMGFISDDIRCRETLSPSIDERMKKYPCDSCDASFTMSNNLRRHVRKSHRTAGKTNRNEVRHSEQEPRRSPIDPPPRVAIMPWDLLLVHEIPPVRLVISSSPPNPNHAPPILRTPSTSRRGNGRYRHVCNVCGASFTFRTNLTRHAKKTHGSVPLENEVT